MSYIFIFLYWLKDKGRPLPKFGEWDVNDPASAEGFTVIFNKARNEKKTGVKPESPSKADQNAKRRNELSKPPNVSFFFSLYINCYYFIQTHSIVSIQKQPILIIDATKHLINFFILPSCKLLFYF